jgi:hypothetical protein
LESAFTASTETGLGRPEYAFCSMAFRLVAGEHVPGAEAHSVVALNVRAKAPTYLRNNDNSNGNKSRFPSGNDKEKGRHKGLRVRDVLSLLLAVSCFLFY